MRFLAWTLATIGFLAVSFALVSQNVCHLGSHSAIEGKVPVDIRTIDRACLEYAINNGGVYPSDLAQLLESEPGRFGYLRCATVPRDPWGRPYLYAPTDEHCHDPRIWTYGRDGLPGGEGDDADHDNWGLRFDLSPP
jgi:general secretion pathway protein G